MAARFDGQGPDSTEWNTDPYYVREKSSYVTPCLRCGRMQQAEACWDCRLVDPENFGNCMNARDWQKHRAAKAASRAVGRGLNLRASAARTARKKAS